MKWITIVALGLWAGGCGSSDSRDVEPLAFEELGDTSRLSKGEALLDRLEPYRMSNGALRLRGALDLPDETRIQVTILDHSGKEMVGRWQMIVRDRRFESPPILGPQGPLPEGLYRIEYLAHFNDVWQPKSVLDATDQGRRLRGPGITQTTQGPGAFFLVEERRL